jgi:hypothetical protein
MAVTRIITIIFSRFNLKLFSTSIILALAGLSLANNTFRVHVPTQSQLNTGAVPGYVLVKYKKEVATAIAQNNKLRPVNKGGGSNTSSGMQFQSKIGTSWIMYRIPSVVDPVAYADYVRQNEPGAITVENVHEVHTLLLPPNDPDFNDVQYDDGSGTFFLDLRADPTVVLSFRRDWHLDDIDALNAWSVWPNQYYTAANKPTNTPLIAVIDSGCDMDHPDFMNAGGTGTDIAQGGQLDKSKSALVQIGNVSQGADVTDHNGHGTHVAGLALASANNGSYVGHGTLGTGYPCKGMIVKCIQDNGSGLDSDVAQSIYYAVDQGADVVSISLGTTFFSQVMQDAVTYATENGAVVVVAGNENGNGGGNLGPIWPAACSGALGITANGPDWQFASFAGYGFYVDLGAPGGDIQAVGDVINADGYYKIQFPWSTATRYTNYIIDNHLAAPPYTMNYTYLPGTSMACPIVSGGLGTYMGKNNLRHGDWSNIKVYRAAELAAQSQGAAFGGWELSNGYGYFDMQALMVDQDSRVAQIGGVEGIVYDGGTAVANVTVRAKKLNPSTGLLTGVTFTTSTFANGNYRFDGMGPGIYDVWAIAFGHRKDFWVEIKAGSDHSGVDFFCGTPVIDSDGPIVQRCNITTSSATGLTVDHFAYDPETRLEDISFQVLNSSNAVVVNPSRVLFEATTVNYSFGSTLPNGSYKLRATYINGEGFTTVVDKPFTIGPALVTVGGTITLQNFSSTTNRTIVMQLRNPGTTTVVESYNLVVHNGSTFNISTAQRGTFDLAFKGAHFMRKVLPGVSITNAGVSGLAPSLKNGDCDGSNVVGTADFNALRAAWGSIPTSPNWNENTDLDGNGVIGTADFNILRNFWGQIGDN